MKRSPIRTFAACCLLLGFGQAEARPLLYFYPTEYRYADGHILNSPQTITVEQITTHFPAIQQMDGVVLIVDWNTLCGSKDRCDFSLIDDVIGYWKKKDKKIVLDVATIGYPYRAPPDGNAITNATPQWVMRQVKTYEVAHPRVLGEKRPDESADIAAMFPDFRDPMFLSLQASLVRELARRYDGNPTIAEIRIASGVLGEENPMVGPLSKPFVSGYREADWMEYCGKLLALYKQNFKKTELEFDISRIPWIRAVGTRRDQVLSDEFVDSLLQNKIFLSFDGWESADFNLMQESGASRSGLVHSLRYLHNYKQRGGRIGLEAIGNLINPRMGTSNLENIRKLAAVINYLQPDRIVFFGDVARLLSEDSRRDRLHARELLDGIDDGADQDPVQQR